MKDYYEILDIDNNVNEARIYQAYRIKINQFNHLPFHTPKMIKEIKLLKEALYVLGDKIKRNKYDKKNNRMKQYEEDGKFNNNTQICDRLFSITFG